MYLKRKPCQSDTYPRNTGMLEHWGKSINLIQYITKLKEIN